MIRQSWKEDEVKVHVEVASKMRCRAVDPSGDTHWELQQEHGGKRVTVPPPDDLQTSGVILEGAKIVWLLLHRVLSITSRTSKLSCWRRSRTANFLNVCSNDTQPAALRHRLGRGKHPPAAGGAPQLTRDGAFRPKHTVYDSYPPGSRPAKYISDVPTLVGNCPGLCLLRNTFRRPRHGPAIRWGGGGIVV